jgi:D-3-phosphoglycerate dehydrogenase
MTFKVLVTEPTLAPAGVAVLREAGCDIRFISAADRGAEQARILASEPIDAVIARGIPIPGDVIRQAKGLRVISRHGVGYNHVDVEAATASGVAVMISTGANAQSVAELAIGLLIAVARGLYAHDETIRAGGWIRPGITAIQLNGRTLGIVGVGAVGGRVARLALAIGMRVVAYDPYVDRGLVPAGVTMVDRIEDLLDEADDLSLHCPQTRETTGLIGAAELARLPAGAILVNTARGPVVDEAAMIAALRSGHLVGAGLDTFEPEPLPPGREIATLPNVILTPHIGGSTLASLDAVASMAAENALKVLRNEPIDPKTCVNPSVLRA